MSKVFVFEPRSGLCNQLNCIAIGLVIGSIYNRQIYFHGFQLDYLNEYELTDFETIIDIDYLNKILKEFKIQTTILKKKDLSKNGLIYENINNIEVLNTENIPIFNIKNIFPFLNIKENLNKQILNLKNPINTILPDEMNNFYNYIRIHIKFNTKYMEITNNIIEKFELNNFCCVHLRIEDDAIEYVNKKNDFDYINDIYKQIYINELEILKKTNTQIYVCTSLGLFENKNNLFYKIIKKQYNLIDKNDLLMELGLNDILEQREICGIIDYLIALKSDYFVGCDWSSFSIAIKNHHDFHKKSYNLLNIWESISKY